MAALAAASLLAMRSWTRAPVWRSTRDLVVSALLNHPESYKVHQSAARVLWRLGLRNEGLAEYGVAAEIYPLDHYLLSEIGSAALETGRVRLAMRVLRQAEQLDTGYSLTQQLMAQGLLRLDSAQAALGHARRAVAADPTRAEPARMLAASLIALGQPDSAVAVWPAFAARGGGAFDRWLLGAVTLAAAGRGGQARLALDSASRLVSMDSIEQRRLAEARIEVGRAAEGVPRP
jgi:tetratricopeptide (TPR) repeat protein